MNNHFDKISTERLAPIFGKSMLDFRWLPSIEESCIHGTYGAPKPSSKIAAFDVDGTLIRVKSGKKFPNGQNDWLLWSSSIPKKLKQIHLEGFTILLISNQNFNGPKPEKDFERKIPQVARALGVPFRIFAAREKDRFRKPLTGMWDEFVANWNDGIQPDLQQSYYVGDAAGRPALGTTKKDWNDTDRKWALNVGVPFFTPEEFFLGQAPRTDFILSGFDPKSYDHDQPAWHPSTTPLAYGPILESTELGDNMECEKIEIVIFVGPPGIGKTTLYNQHFATRGYHHVNQDKLKTFEKCLESVRQTIGSGKPCVVDNTNPSQRTRSAYVKLARELQCEVRCLVFCSPIELARHNNVYRAIYRTEVESRQLLPGLAFEAFKKNFEEPSLDEGFDEIKRVNFIFNGSLGEREIWHKYLV
ncbi:hypothetical protein CROQUDRAFT_659941 [Cronartium quercuum f. sp. fusiforme G11]|uniref:Bifunctional polynucleotide phosphatase/kinase n=1 Tax=Cronartium quercuum f. sp. fusiforme G11 TaxID=708437 RepID=A0A9P6T9T8_9BASI|nr:hypothetical protein CROQUDRAFT_659941 [Cronartium quercuum f. sp. fusiforme G11]